MTATHKPCNARVYSFPTVVAAILLFSTSAGPSLYQRLDSARYLNNGGSTTSSSQYGWQCRSVQCGELENVSAVNSCWVGQSPF